MAKRATGKTNPAQTGFGETLLGKSQHVDASRQDVGGQDVAIQDVTLCAQLKRYAARPDPSLKAAG
jgi:hypothetical protein